MCCCLVFILKHPSFTFTHPGVFFFPSDHPYVLVWFLSVGWIGFSRIVGNPSSWTDTSGRRSACQGGTWLPHRSGLCLAFFFYRRKSHKHSKGQQMLEPITGRWPWREEGLQEKAAQQGCGAELTADSQLSQANSTLSGSHRLPCEAQLGQSFFFFN